MSHKEAGGSVEERKGPEETAAPRGGRGRLFVEREGVGSDSAEQRTESLQDKSLRVSRQGNCRACSTGGRGRCECDETTLEMPCSLRTRSCRVGSTRRCNELKLAASWAEEGWATDSEVA